MCFYKLELSFADTRWRTKFLNLARSCTISHVILCPSSKELLQAITLMTWNYFWNHLSSCFCERSNSKTSIQLCMLILLWHNMHPVASARRSKLQHQTLQKGHPCHSVVFQFRFDPVLGDNYTIKYLGV